MKKAFSVKYDRFFEAMTKQMVDLYFCRPESVLEKITKIVEMWMGDHDVHPDLYFLIEPSSYGGGVWEFSADELADWLELYLMEETRIEAYNLSFLRSPKVKKISSTP